MAEHNIRIVVTAPKPTLRQRYSCPYCGKIDLRPGHVQRKHRIGQ